MNGMIGISNDFKKMKGVYIFRVGNLEIMGMCITKIKDSALENREKPKKV